MEPNTIILILSVLVGIEQVVAEIPAVKANSTFRVICNVTNSVMSFITKIGRK